MKKSQIFVAAAAMLFLIRPVLADDLYAAVAYSAASKAIGIAKDKPSREEAEKAALTQCGASSCKNVIYVKNGCAALAVAKDGSWGSNWGTDQPDAGQKAISACNNYAKSACQVRTMACVSGTELPPTAQSKGCQDEQSSPDDRIQNCTAMRNAKDATPGTKRIALSNRADAWEAKGDDARAIADYTEALTFDPKNASLYESRGVLRMKQDDKLCMADFDKAIQLDPKSSSAYRNRGNAKIAFVSFEKAIPDVMKAIELDPKDDLAYRILAHAKYEIALNGDTSFDGALVAIDKSIELAPGKAETHVRRGNILSAMKDYDRASAAYGEAIRIDPKDADRYFSRCSVYAKKGDFDKSISDCDAGIRLAPKDDDGFSLRCWARTLSGRDLPAALADCDEALRLKADRTESLERRGFLLLRLNRWDDAIAAFNDALKQEAKQGAAFYGRGIAKLKKGDEKGGNADLAAAKENQSDMADIFKKWASDITEKR